MNTNGTFEQVLESSREAIAHIQVTVVKAGVPVLAMKLIGLKAMRCTARLKGETERYAELNAQVQEFEAAIDTAVEELSA